MASPYAVVTGIGAVTPYGVGAQVLREGLLAGRPTAGPIHGIDASDLPVRFACEVPDFDATACLPANLARRTDRFSQFALVAAGEALAAAGLLEDGGEGPQLDPGVDPDRVAVVIASGNGGGRGNSEAYQALRSGGPRRVSPYLTLTRPVDAAAAAVAHHFRLGGPALGVATACASGTDALGMGLDLLRAGRAAIVVAGGAEAAVERLTLAAFARTGALSRRNDDPAAASRPFDADRDGFVCGEGAGVLLLERPEHALARRATVLAKLAGYGATTDPRHPIGPPHGAAAARAVHLALRDAGLTPRDVEHVDAHGTATVLNDPAEARALRTVLGVHLDAVPVTAIKSAIGHLMGAAGAVAAVAAVGTISDGLVPPTQNHYRTDPECDLDVVAGRPRPVAPRVVLSEAFGFGGHNSAIMLVAP